MEHLELRLLNLEAQLLLQRCELDVFREAVASLLPGKDAKALDIELRHKAIQRLRQTLGALSDAEPNRASELARFFEKQLNREPPPLSS